MKKTVLVTGGFGYVGSRLTPLLLSKGYSVRVIDLCLYGDDGYDYLLSLPEFKNWKARFELIRADIRDPQAVQKAVSGVDAIIHLAAISNDPTGEIDESLTRQVNFDAVGMILSLAKKAGVKQFINASSSSVFGVKPDQDITELLEPEPITFYSRYKMLSEWLVVSASSPTFCTTNIRPATICGYSPRQRFDLTVNKLVADAIRTGTITVNGGQQRRPNVGMTDMVALYSQLLETDVEKINGKTFNFGFENHTILNIAEMIKREFSDLPVQIVVKDVVDKRDYHISSNKIITELGYKPISSIRAEAQNLRHALKTQFPNINEERFYNMKSMKLERQAGPYSFLSTAVATA